MKKVTTILISAIILATGAEHLNVSAKNTELFNENLEVLLADEEPSWTVDCYKSITSTTDFRDQVVFCPGCTTLHQAKGLDYGGKGKCIPPKNTEIQ